jgi:hypothetical protein
MKKLDVPELELTAEQLATVRAIKTRNAAFWDALKEPPEPHTPDALLRAEALRLTVRAAQREAVRASNLARSMKAAEASAAKRAPGKFARDARDRRIHDAKGAGALPKNIATDENLNIRLVHTILRRPRPANPKDA